MSVGEQIKKCRNKIKISQKELGEKLGVSQAMIAQYESGKRLPKFETIQKIAKVLNVPANVLMETTLFYDSFIPTEWLKDDSYKPILDVLREEHHINSTSDKECILPMENAINQIYQNKLLSSFNTLNELGKEKAIERVEELTEIKKYTK